MLNFLGSLLGPVIGGGLGLVGGMMNQSNQAAMNQANIAASEQINQQQIANQDFINAENLSAAKATQAQQIASAKEFAQKGIQWVVNDARQAGISPLAALGASNNPTAPQLVGTNVAQASFNPSVPRSEATQNGPGTALANIGQDVSRAIQNTRSPEEQAMAIEKTRQDLESGQLDNELKKAQLGSAVTRLKSAQVGPGIPHPNASNNDAVTVLREPDGSLVSGPSRASEGWSWSNPFEKFQFGAREVERFMGWDIPKSLGSPSPGFSWYKNPITGKYYQSPDAMQMWDAFKHATGAYGSAVSDNFGRKRTRIEVSPSARDWQPLSMGTYNQ